MHSYLRAIGFSNLRKRTEIDQLLETVFRESHNRKSARKGRHDIFIEYGKSFGKNMGIILCGSLEEDGFHQEYYFPYFLGSGETTKEDLVIEKRSQNDSFAGVCEDMRVGVSLIFYLQNAAEYIRESILNRLMRRDISTTLSGLSLQGKILLPIRKTEEQVILDKEATKNRSHLIAEARKGNEEAMESLTLEDIDTYTMISRRVHQEDVFTIVDSFFMPYGMECDHYNVLGEIKKVEKVQNEITGEQVYQMNLECNGMNFDICINEKDLQGEPLPGRRFKGNIWLQGRINFPPED